MPNPLSSFRAQMVAFVATLLIVTTIVLYLVNRRAEQQITAQVETYIGTLIQAVDTFYTSLNGTQYLYQLINDNRPDSLVIDEDSIVRHILVVDEKTNIITNSTNRDEIKKPGKSDLTHLPPFQQGDLLGDEDEQAQEAERTIKFSIETSKDNRYTVIFVISLRPFYRVVNAAARQRLLASLIWGGLMLLVTAAFTARFTRPITKLGQAAQQVTAGQLDFNVPVAGPEEIAALSATFNEMLAGLRHKRELEEQLQKAERSAVVGRLASGIAHEIRNPLNFMNLSIDHLQAKCAPEAPGPRAEHQHILTTIKDEIARLNRLVSDFLSYGRPARLKLRELDAQTLIGEVRSLVGAQAEQQGVKVSIEKLGDENTQLRGDAEQIKTCFSNLMINAVQAMPEGGALQVRLQPDAAHIAIQFADTGVGIGPEALEQIFEPYYSTKETGIGLGLPLTKKIIEEHGGQISVQSAAGAGTTFTVVLPREPK